MSPTPYSLCLATTNLFSVAMNSVSVYFLFVCFRFHIQVRSYSIWFSLSGLFHLAKRPQGPSMLLQMAGFPFILLNNISFYHIIFIHLSNCGHLCCFHISQDPQPGPASLGRSWGVVLHGISAKTFTLKCEIWGLKLCRNFTFVDKMWMIWSTCIQLSLLFFILTYFYGMLKK